mgnify:CR=1 FL=1
MDSEARTIVEESVPLHPITGGSGYFNLREYQPNARVFVDERGRLNIYLVEGGWLGVEEENLLGDVAPFSG